jgi:glycosyltransferase involved in cell wall biosynthesis
MESELSPGYRLIYRFLRRLIEHADKSFIFAMRRYSSLVVANSKFCASLYERHGIGVDDVIYPPVELEVFKPTTSSPSSDYALAYFGKESKLSVIRMVADRGVRLKVFGFKAHPAKNALTHPNIECLWNISDSELADAYSNALFTIFTFTHEPFGYVPVESMACGTPVLTYGAQGPGEYVVGGRTGWIAHTDEELVEKAVELWRSGYPEGFRRRCVEFASGFDKHAYSKRLFKVLNCGLTHIGHV